MSYLEQAREIAARCWCTPTTSERTMDVNLAEVFAVQLAGWMETAAQNDRNTAYYRGLLDKIASFFGDAAYISDDGSKQDEPLRAKLPDLMQSLVDSHHLCEDRFSLMNDTIVTAGDLLREWQQIVKHQNTMIVTLTEQCNRLQKQESK